MGLLRHAHKHIHAREIMPSVLTDIPGRQAAKYGKRTAVAYYRTGDGVCTEMSWTTFHSQIHDMAAAFVRAGVKPGMRVAILSANSPQMLVTDFAAYANGAVTVPIYATASDTQIRYILNDCGAAALIVGDADKLHAVLALAAECPALRLIITVASASDITPDTDTTVQCITYDAFLESGQNHPDADNEVTARSAAVSDNDMATLIYTSGTTGEPKGAILTHGNFNAVMRIHRQRLTMLSDTDTSLCFLPLTHIFERAWSYFCLDTGMVVTVNGTPSDVNKVLRKVRPTCMCAVPRFWEKVYTAIMEKIENAGRIRRFLMRRAMKTGWRRNLVYARMGLSVPRILEWRYRFWDKKVLSPVRAAIGIDHGNIFPTAGAPMSPTIVEFFHSMGVNIVIGYGLSETTATVTCYPQTGYEIGTVGTPMPEISVTTGAEGEILVKGPTVMKGYYGKPEDTAKVFDSDGWFHTGDAGTIDASGSLILTERIKDLFKTSNGKYIAPQALESRLAEDRYIEQVAVIGESRKYVTAIIIPAFKALRKYARSKKIAFRNNTDLIRNLDIRAMLQRRIDRCQADLAAFEQVKRFTLLPHEFTIESGELTNTLKLRRPVINRHYARQIEEMYR